MNYCYSTLQPLNYEGFSPVARKSLHSNRQKKFPFMLGFTRADLALPVNERKGEHQSISGVQDKVQLDYDGTNLNIVEKGGTFILKPIPSNPSAKFKDDIPANEHLTMQIARQIFGIDTAVNACVRFKDGELAYLTKRFDRREGEVVHQEDLCQLMGRTEETHGKNYKYDTSYEEIADAVRSFCPAHKIALYHIFYRILFNYVFANGDAHLKNFSFCQGANGDYVLSPAYDLLNTLLHFPNEPGRTALDLFKDDYMTEAYEELGFYTEPDFIRLGDAYGISEAQVIKMIKTFHAKKAQVEDMISRSFLSPESKSKYVDIFHDRLMAFRNSAR